MSASFLLGGNSISSPGQRWLEGLSFAKTPQPIGVIDRTNTHQAATPQGGNRFDLETGRPWLRGTRYFVSGTQPSTPSFISFEPSVSSANPKSKDFHLSFRLDEQVGGFDVAMCDSLPMCVPEAVGDLAGRFQGFLERQRPRSMFISRLAPAMNSKARKVFPSTSSISYIVQMFGWFSAPAGFTSLSYTFRQARRAMKLAELQQQVKPDVQKYLPGSFSGRIDGVVSESFDGWVEALDTFVENLAGNGPESFGDTLISLDLSVPAVIASGWLNAPPERPEELCQHVTADSSSPEGAHPLLLLPRSQEV